MIQSFLTAFGFTGIASILLALVASLLCWGCFYHRERVVMASAAFALSCGALFLAKWTSTHVNGIRPDRSEQMREAMEFQQNLRAEYGASSSMTKRARFAEDHPLDASLGESDSLSDPYRAALQDASEPAYRLKG